MTGSPTGRRACFSDVEVVAPGEQLVDVGLVPGVPEQHVARAVEDTVQRNGQLDDTEVRSQVATGSRDVLDQKAADLGGELRRALPEESALTSDGRAICESSDTRVLLSGRMERPRSTWACADPPTVCAPPRWPVRRALAAPRAGDERLTAKSAAPRGRPLGVRASSAAPSRSSACSVSATTSGVTSSRSSARARE